MEKYGLLHDEIQPEDYVLGGHKLSGTVLMETGDWSSYLPLWEAQERLGVETMSCATFATLNALEALFLYHFDAERNYSDRYNAIMSGTTIVGNSPQTVIESIRNDAGVIPESLFPFGEPKSFAEYHSGVEKHMMVEGARWLDKYEIGHEWVFNGGNGESKSRAIMEALKYSPIGVSVKAWEKDGEYYVKNESEVDNHWVTAFRAVEGEYIEIYDQYEVEESPFKRVKWGTNFNMAKRYSLKKKEKVEQINWFIDILNRLWLFIKGLAI